ncbi:Ser/Thr protein phosphatase family protein [Colletotrichum tofieldiae]|nr:Ser/Thr protein phosphatase family protein [Colletotrichum tofieldiae]
MDASTPSSRVKTRILIISDTHGASSLPGNRPLGPVDVVFHCGDLKKESKLAEFHETLNLMNSIKAPLKLVIAGNHDWTLDAPIFAKKIAEIPPPVDMEMARRRHDDFGEARRLLQASAKNEDDNVDDADVVLLDEGTHTFALSNGALLNLFASHYSYTLSGDDRGFHGVLDRTATGSRLGCPVLLTAVALALLRARTSGLGRDGIGGHAGRAPASHFEAFDNDWSVVVEPLAGLTPGRSDEPGAVAERRRKLEACTARGCYATSHCAGDEHPLVKGEQTLFVNAAIEEGEDQPQHLPWIVDIELPSARGAV